MMKAAVLKRFAEVFGDVEGAKQLLAANDIYPEDYDDLYLVIRKDEKKSYRENSRISHCPY